MNNHEQEKWQIVGNTFDNQTYKCEGCQYYHHYREYNPDDPQTFAKRTSSLCLLLASYRTDPNNCPQVQKEDLKNDKIN